MAWVWLDKIGNYTLSKYPGKEPTPDFVGSTSLTASGLVRGNSPLDVTTGPNMDIVFNIVEGLKVTITSTSESTPRQTVSIYIQNSPLVQYTYVWGTGVNLAIGFGYDVNLQRADMYIMNANSALGKTYCNGIAHATDDYPSAETLTYAQMSILYSYLIKTLETYDWESVRSVEGKGKTYKLTKYLNINNGYPVNNVSYVNNVDVSAKSKVNNMVSDVIVDEDKVTVKYVIPAGSYSYIKLVYKKDSIPSSYTDGTATDITQSSTSKVFSKLKFKETGVYWFMIFTDRSSSEPVSLDMRGYNPVPVEYQDYIDLINGNNDMFKYYLRDNWLAYLSEYEFASGMNCQWIKTSKNYSYVNIRNNTYGRPSIGSWDHDYARTKYVSTNKFDEYSGKYTAKILSMEPIDVYINGSENSYTLTTSTQVPVIILSSGIWDTVYGFEAYIKDGENVVRVAGFTVSYPEIQAFTYTGTLEDCFKYAAMNLRNVNIYVNGVLWSEKIS